MADPSVPFSIPFEVSARQGRLWIRPEWASNTTGDELLLKGASWFGAQGGFACVMQLNIYTADDYLRFLHRFSRRCRPPPGREPAAQTPFVQRNFLQTLHVKDRSHAIERLLKAPLPLTF